MRSLSEISVIRYFQKYLDKKTNTFPFYSEVWHLDNAKSFPSFVAVIVQFWNNSFPVPVATVDVICPEKYFSYDIKKTIQYIVIQYIDNYSVNS